MNFIKKLKNKDLSVDKYFVYVITVSLLVGLATTSLTKFYYMKELAVSAFSFLGNLIGFVFHVGLHGAVIAGLIILFTLAYFMFANGDIWSLKDSKK